MKEMQARSTHILESIEEGTNQNTENKQVGKQHSQTGEHRERHDLEYERKRVLSGALTLWEVQRDEQVRTV